MSGTRTAIGSDGTSRRTNHAACVPPSPASKAPGLPAGSRLLTLSAVTLADQIFAAIQEREMREAHLRRIRG